MNQLRLFFVLITTFLSLSFISFSQVNEGGIPSSFTAENLSPAVISHDFPKPDMEKLTAEDEMNAQSQYPGPERMAYSVLVNLDIKEAGLHEYLNDGTEIWRLKIHVPDALALGVYYSDFYLPEDAKLFLYNESKTQVIGAFTSANNAETRLFANEFIQGDAVTLEYTEPAGTTEKASVFISEVAYAYRFIDFTYEGGNRDQSWACMINVKCSEGNGWENQSQGVARLSIKIGYNYYWCSGSLINNTNNDRTPYLLTAEHCGEGANSSDLNQWIFYFNYQSSTCTGNYGPTNNTMTGCQLKARDPLNSYDGSDFELVKLNGTPPSGYNVYYNGWNRTNDAADSGVCLHHPAGDIKKVSTYDNMVSSTWWNGTPSHWRVIWKETEHGLSIMQGGSSGSAIFDQNGHIMGDLSGGYESNSCNSPSPAWYGKLWFSWDQCGDIASERLMDWLDPAGTGAWTHPGLSSQILPPNVDFTADTTYILQGEMIHFTDLTTGNPSLSWAWSFPGGTPNASDIQNPTITYNTAGTFNVTLTVTNADGEGTETKTGYITVEQVLQPEADFVASAVDITEGDQVDFTDLTANNPVSWSWIFNGGTPAASTEQNPDSIVYSLPGTYNVYLTATNNGGSDTELKENYITVNAGIAPTSDFYADNTEILPGDSVNFFDLSIGNPTQWTWTFEGGVPGTSGIQNPVNIVYPTEGQYYVRLRTKNSFGNNTIQKDKYITVGNVSVGEINKSKGVLVYPNPTSGIFTVKLLEGIEFWGSNRNQNPKPVVAEVINSIGNVVRSAEINKSTGTTSFDLSNEAAGLYIIRVSSDNRSVQKIISLMK